MVYKWNPIASAFARCPLAKFKLLEIFPSASEKNETKWNEIIVCINQRQLLLANDQVFACGCRNVNCSNKFFFTFLAHKNPRHLQTCEKFPPIERLSTKPKNIAAFHKTIRKMLCRRNVCCCTKWKKGIRTQARYEKLRTIEQCKK